MFTLWTTHPGWQAVGWTMIHFLWIGTLIGLSAWVGRMALHRCRPLVRYLFLTGCFVLLAVIPWPILWHLLDASAPVSFHEGPPINHTMAVRSSVEFRNTEPIAFKPGFHRISASVLSVSPPVDPVEHPWYGQWKTRLSRISLIAPWIWLIGTPLTLLSVSCGFAGARHLRRHSRSLPEPWVAELANRLRLVLNLGQEVAIAISEKVAAPILVGVIKPMILQPPALINGCTHEQMEMILLHELAHVKRWDPWVNLFLQLARCLLFFHPAVWMVSRWMRVDRESCCDDIVVQLTGQPETYAQTLVHLAMPDGYPLVSSLALARHPLVHRIRRILQGQDHSLHFSPTLFITVTLLCLGGLTLAIGATRGQAESTALIETLPNKHILHFPDDQTIGSLSICKNSDYDSNSAYNQWDPLTHAVGQVEIPAHHRIKLSIRQDAASDLSFLRNLSSNDIHYLNLRWCKVSAANLGHVAHLTGLNTLILDQSTISDQGLKSLGQLSQLRCLGLDSTSIGDDGLAHLSPCTSLTHIGLSRTRITDRGLATLSQLQALQKLDLAHTQISDTGLEHLSTLKDLQELQLGHTPISDTGLRHLSTLKNLRRLQFGKLNVITDKGLRHLSALTALEHLHLSGLPITDKGLSSLASLTALKTLSLDRTKITGTGCVHLKGLKALEALHLPRNIGAQAWTPLAGHPNLRSFIAPSDAHLAKAVLLPALRRLEIRGKCTDAGMDYVAKMSQLQDIHINFNSVADRSRSRITALKEMRNLNPDERVAMLRRLNETPVDLHSVTDAGFSKLANLKGLLRLSLSDTRITDAGLRILPSFPALESLSLSRFRGSTDGLKHLAHLNHLKSLSLSFDDSDALTDEAIAPIAQLTSLNTLFLEGPLSDRAVQHLTPLTQLTQLKLRGTWLTDKGIAHLIGFPKLEILRAKGHFTNRAILDLVKLTSLRMLTLTGNIEISQANEVILAAMPSMQAHYLRLERGSPESRSKALWEKLAAKPGMERLRIPEPLAPMERFVDANGDPGVRWSYTFQEVNGSATLDMYGVTIVFERELRSGFSQGMMQVRGAGSGSGRSGAGDRVFSKQYENGVTTMRFGKHEFTLLDGGNRLSIGGIEVDLSRGKKRVTLKKDGSVTTTDI